MAGVMPAPFRFAERVGLAPHRALRRLGRYWASPWFWITGAFGLALMWWVLVAELWVACGIVFGVVWCARWLLAMMLVGPKQAVESRRQDKIHAARPALEDW